MSEDEIKGNPSLKKLRENADGLRQFRKAWPLLKPIAKVLGADTAKVDEALAQAGDLDVQIDQMTATPDRFNSLFSEIGWIMFDSMDLETAKKAIAIAEAEGLIKADTFLADAFSPEWVEKRINWLKYINGFRSRFELVKKALEDYKAGRYYASVLVVLSLIDGWVSELNIIDFQRYGFFSEKSRLVAWDSIAAHPKGLVKLKEALTLPRLRTRTEEITIPHRHGIMHGMDLGYDNRFVAAKCWATLFAVRDWAIKATKNELNPPTLEPEVEKTLWETIESYQKSRYEIEKMKEWKPREIKVGETIPTKGDADDFPPITPERKIVEFLSFWKKNNYGYMARCYAPLLRMEPGSVRDQFQHLTLLEFELVEINEVTPTTADIRVTTRIRRNSEIIEAMYEFRLVCSDINGELVYLPNDDSVWGITFWRAAK